MKNILTMILVLIALTSRASSAAIGEALVFDTIYDEHVSIVDPRFAGFVYSAKSHKNSIAMIKYNGEDGYFLTKNLIREFDKYNISYTVMELKSQQKNKVFIELRQDDNE
ncbi:MAG: hypothetical protein EKK54_06025 [Neisseriaceae bacterium]|nr:MAG: hypothetical protein EKK54_06025 [Neisseriaceae bacterium]